MYDLGGNRHRLDAQRRRAKILATSWHRSGGSGRKGGRGFQLPANFRQPCRFQQTGQSGRARDLEGSDRQGEWPSGQTRLHDPHRRFTHLSKAGQFDDAEKVIGEAKLDVHYVPGEHDLVDEDNGKAYLGRFGKNTKGTGWYSFDAGGVHFIGLVNAANLKAGGMGSLGDEQIAWLTDDLKGKGASTPVVVVAHIPLWTVYADWGWGTEDSARALALLKRFGSVTVLNGHIHQLMQKVEGHVTFRTARSTAFPQPAPGTAPSPGHLLVTAEKLRTVLGIKRRGQARQKSPRDHRYTA
ncbi:MAG: 3',5'-cyclic adenosine monophosphate phosphodiesterase CpdA [Beijerinckiaceae bacterium]|nr:MAG: 3',5'-cyclic adenosine monophosphate phosphodiesterase CpdA [Beijerinckiaceae bacterium]